MDAIFQFTYSPETIALPRPSTAHLSTPSRSSDSDSPNTSASSTATSTPTLDGEEFLTARDLSSSFNNPHHRGLPTVFMDSLFIHQTIGLPVFIQPCEEKTNISASPVPDQIHDQTPELTRQCPSPSSNDLRNSSIPTTTSPIICPRRLSKAFDLAITSLETLVKKSATLFLEDAEVDESRYTGQGSGRQNALLPGGMRMGVGNALLDKDGCVQGWLD